MQRAIDRATARANAIAAREAAMRARAAAHRKAIIDQLFADRPNYGSLPGAHPKPASRPTPYLASTSATTSVKLGAATRNRLYTLADRRGRSAHALMKEAIVAYLDRAEAIDWYRAAEAATATAPSEEATADAAASDGAANEGAVAESRAGFVHSRLVPGSVIPDAVAKMILDGTNRLRALRGWRGFSIGRVMAMLAVQGIDIGEGELAAIEAGRRMPQPHLIAALAHVLAVTVEDLTG